MNKLEKRIECLENSISFLGGYLLGVSGFGVCRTCSIFWSFEKHGTRCPLCKIEAVHFDIEGILK